nr:papilin-like isoform X1 [Dermacentor andersoni]
MWALHAFAFLLVTNTIVGRSTRVDARNYSCDIPPTVESCSIVHRKWSFVLESNRCEITYVCSDHPNRFHTKEDCEAACPRLTDHTPLPRDDCSYWITHLDQCKFKRETSYPDRRGRRQPTLLYRFCGERNTKLYAYYFRTGHCVGAQSRASACLETPTVENCSLVRLKWSFNAQLGRCERNYVCSNHPNAFQDEASCMAMCPSVTDNAPLPRDDCSYWIQHLDQCEFKRETFYPDPQGRRQRVLLYRFCGEGNTKLYAYYFISGECSGAQSTASACLEAPTVEDCSLVRLKWSFNTNSGRCERNYVCSNHTNAFLDEASCVAMCSSVPSPQPPETFKDCSYWLLRLEECKQKWLTSYRGFRGRIMYAFIYTECGSSPQKYYAYFLAHRRCSEVDLRLGRTNQ